MERVEDVMERMPGTVFVTETVGKCLDVLTNFGVHELPVVDLKGQFVSLATEHALRRYSRRGITELPLGQITLESGAACTPDDDVIRVLAKQLREGREATVVVDDGRRPVGIITQPGAMSLARACLAPWTTVAHLVTVGDAPMVSPTATCGQVIAAMQAKDCRHVLVMQGRELRGAISWRELIGHDQRPCGEMLSHVVRKVHTTDSADRAIQRLIASPGECMPVMDDKEVVVGLLTPRDVVKALTAQLLRLSMTPAPTRRR